MNYRRTSEVAQHEEAQGEQAEGTPRPGDRCTPKGRRSCHHPPAATGEQLQDQRLCVAPWIPCELLVHVSVVISKPTAASVSAHELWLLGPLSAYVQVCAHLLWLAAFVDGELVLYGLVSVAGAAV